MNRKKVFHTVGLMLLAEAALMLLPAIVATLYGEFCAWALLGSALVVLISGLALRFFCRPESHVIYAREGFVTVAMTWLAMSAVGALLANEKILAKMGNKMNEGMLMPYEKMFREMDKKGE